MQIAPQYFSHQLRRCLAFKQNRAGVVIAQRRGRNLQHLLTHRSRRFRQLFLGEHARRVPRVEHGQVAYDHAVRRLRGNLDLERRHAFLHAHGGPLVAHETMQRIDRAVFHVGIAQALKGFEHG